MSQTILAMRCVVRNARRGGRGGEIYMIHAGLFRDVDAVLAWRPADINEVNLYSMLATNGSKFRSYGVAANAAAAREFGYTRIFMTQ